MKTDCVPQSISDSHVRTTGTPWRARPPPAVVAPAGRTTRSTRSTTNDGDGQLTNHYDGRVGDDPGRASPMGRAARADPATLSLGPGLSGPRALSQPVPLRQRKRPSNDFELAALS